MKILSNLSEFVSLNQEIERYVACFFSGVYTFLHVLLMPLIANQYFISIIALIILDTIMGTYLSVRKRKFNWKVMAGRTLAKCVKYAIYIQVTLFIIDAPLKMLTLPITAGLFTYIILREATSVLKHTSEAFDDKGMHDLTDKAEDTLVDMTNRSVDKKTQSPQ